MGFFLVNVGSHVWFVYSTWAFMLIIWGLSHAKLCVNINTRVNLITFFAVERELWRFTPGSLCTLLCASESFCIFTSVRPKHTQTFILCLCVFVVAVIGRVWSWVMGWLQVWFLWDGLFAEATSSLCYCATPQTWLPNYLPITCIARPKNPD